MTMKKFIYDYILALALTVSMASCYSDDSTSSQGIIGDITVTGIEDSYAKTAYMGERLIINPKVESNEDMTYSWLLINSETGSVDEAGDTIQPIVIGHEKDLDYEVNIAPATYTVRFIAQGKSGYTVYEQTKLVVRTDFSQGFYVLKETADGNTDVDLLTLDGKKGNDIITNMDGEPLAGKPLVLRPLYSTAYIDDDTNQMTSDNTICITTDKGGLRISRATDFKQVLGRSNIEYDEMDADEQPYTFFSTIFYNCMSTSKGLYSTYPGGSSWGESSGQYGLPVSECGGSRFLFSSPKDYGTGVLWDADAHSLLAFDYNISTSPLVYSDMTGEEETQNLTNYECLHCGFSNLSIGRNGLFVLQDKASSKRYLYLASSSFFGCYLSSRTAFKAGSHLANASYYATNATSASYIYCVDGGKLYAANFMGDLDEIELKTEGIGSGETINFVANQVWAYSSGNTDTFDYLIVGTQSGDGYKLYFYNTNGGAPVGTPVFTMEGKGTVKGVRFLNDSAPEAMFGIYAFNAND